MIYNLISPFEHPPTHIEHDVLIAPRGAANSRARHKCHDKGSPLFSIPAWEEDEGGTGGGHSERTHKRKVAGKMKLKTSVK